MFDQPAECPNLAALVYDANRFLLSNRKIVEDAPLQIYCSALLFSPGRSKIRAQFKHLIPTWITQEPRVESDWTFEVSVLEGHALSVECVAFSPTDDLIASVSHDGTTRVWNYLTGSELYKFDNPDNMSHVSFSPDGRSVLSGSFLGGVIIIREFAKGTEIVLKGIEDMLESVKFSPTNNNIVAATTRDSLQIWDVEKRCETAVFEADKEEHLSQLSFSPDGQFVAVASGEFDNRGGYIRLWDLGKGQLHSTLKGHNERATAVAFSMDGKVLASGDMDGTVKLWDPIGGREVHQIQSPRYGMCRTLAFFQQNRGALAIHWDLTVQIHEAETWQMTTAFDLDDYALTAALTCDGKFLAAGCSDNSVRLIDTVNNICLERTEQGKHINYINEVTFLPGDDNAVVSTGAYMITDTILWDVGSGLIRSKNEDGDFKNLSPDKRFVALEKEDNTVQLWDRDMTRNLITFDRSIRVTFSPDSNLFALWSMEGVRLVDTTTLDEVKIPDIPISCEWLDFSPNSRVLAWVDDDSTGQRMLYLWDRLESKNLVTHPCSDSSPFIIKFSPNGELVAFQAGNLAEPGDFLLLEVATGNEKGTLAGGQLDACVDFDPDGRLVATAAGSRPQVYVYEAASGREIFTFDVCVPGDNDLLNDGLSLSAPGTLLTWSSLPSRVGNLNCTIRMWDLSTGTEIGRLQVEDRIERISFSNDFSYLIYQKGHIPLPLPAPSSAEKPKISKEALENAQNHVHIGRQWVIQGFDDNLLWLPPAYRATAVGVKGGKVAIGNASGTVSFIGLDLDKTPLANRVESV